MFSMYFYVPDPLSSEKKKSTYSNTLPYIVLGSLSVLGGLVCLFLPETANENLPESVADAELFGARQSFFHVPCLAK